MSQDAGAVARRAFNPAVVVALCFGVAALEGYDIQAFGVAAPRLVPDLGLNPGQQGWAASAAMFGLVAGAMLGGWLADRFGRRPVLVGSVVLFGLFSVATALSQGYDQLLLARLLTGIGFGGAMPNLIAIASEISPPEKRAATTTTMFCGMPAGGAVVALLARFYGQELDWRTIFMIGGVLPLVIAPALYFLLPETKPVQAKDADRNLGRALFGAGRATPTLLLWAAFILTLVVLYLMLNWLPTLVVAKGLTPADGSSAALAFNLASIPGALLLGFIVDRAGFRWPLVACYLGLAVAMWVLGQAAALGVVVTLAGVAGFLMLGANYSLYALAPALYPPQVRASASGAAIAVGRVGSIIGPLIAGELRAAGWSANDVIATTIPVVIVAGVATLIVCSIAKLNPES
jgi:MFS transporter, AAHS family, 3-hydroxyphenylpropionic acid transporter